MAKQETWNSRLGVILAVAGSAVGIGNFLRFPGNVAQYGGGAFMMAYVISFLIIGLPICWAEWTIGRYAGQRGFHSPVGIFHTLIGKPWGKFLGVVGVVIPACIYIYYVVIEAWCLGYAVNFLVNPGAYAAAGGGGAFFGIFTGIGADGSGWGFGIEHVGAFLVVCFALNFFLIYRGLSKGIELFCNYAMPALIVIALIVLVRVLTLGTPNPEQPSWSIQNGLGFMWNPTKVMLVETVPTDAGELVTTQRQIFGAEIAAAEARAQTDKHVSIKEISVWQQLAKPDLWLAASGQIFFSLSIGFGLIMTYASYLKKDDDVVLSGLTATAANEFAEVGLGGLITVPAAVAFFGVSAGVGSTVGLGFVTLPDVFARMGATGPVFGFLFFFLLFLAAVTSSLSMLQPGIAFLEGSLRIGRKTSVAMLGVVTAIGAAAVVSFSQDVKMLDHLDFWAGTFLIFILATLQIIAFGWIFGAKRGLEEAAKGSAIRIPGIYRWVIQFVTPAFLLTIFVFWVRANLAGGPEGSSYVRDLLVDRSPGAWAAIIAIGFLLLATTAITVLTHRYLDYDQSADPE